MIVGTRDPFGFDRLHYHPRSGVSASGIRAVLRQTCCRERRDHGND